MCPNIDVPPHFCQYACGPCDQDFSRVTPSTALFLYSSQPPSIAATIERAVEELQLRHSERRWITWKDLPITGQIIFCTICKAMRFASHVVTDVTTLNFNLMFEIGFALGLGLPIIPIRDTSLLTDKLPFDELGLLDTIGFTDFVNSQQLATLLPAKLPVSPMPSPAVSPDREQPLYVVKGPLETEGEVRLLSTLKKSALRFR